MRKADGRETAKMEREMQAMWKERRGERRGEERREEREGFIILVLVFGSNASKATDPLLICPFIIELHHVVTHCHLGISSLPLFSNLSWSTNVHCTTPHAARRNASNK
jgi:hypothetical protein